ncbi:pectin lyase-like protein [Aureobasidium namibiae CBS 147.97]|uniref:Pectate lyase n=1 Tax=Aureobasidium namibiae CBS 147.97 TaxID=1043004 RepID=A0A074WWI1_9PEZI
MATLEVSPKATSTKTNSKVITVKADTTYDGKADAVFLLEAGATLKNAIIGKSQAESDVCEDAISIKNDNLDLNLGSLVVEPIMLATKVVQHSGCGTVNIIDHVIYNLHLTSKTTVNSTADCGNCSKQCKRNVYIEGVTAKNGDLLVGINSNYGDTATIKNTCSDAKTKCQMFKGCAGSCEPPKAGLCSG